MAVSYKKLWHILVDREMKKKDLESGGRNQPLYDEQNEQGRECYYRSAR